MKLVIGGGTGFVGKTLLKQALLSPQITSIITLGRRSTAVSDPKLTDFALNDLENYPDEVKAQIADADACIWTIAVAYTKSLSSPEAVNRKVSYDYTLAGIKTLSESRSPESPPLRFIYFSGAAVHRDLDGVHVLESGRLRAEVEIMLVDQAAKSERKIRVCCVRPSYILGPRGGEYVQPQLPSYVPTIKIEECVAAVLEQALNGIAKDPILNEELVEIGQENMSRYILA